MKKYYIKRLLYIILFTTKGHKHFLKHYLHNQLQAGVPLLNQSDALIKSLNGSYFFTRSLKPTQTITI